MAEGFRVTEDGSLRVTESLDLRITEQYVAGFIIASFSAVASNVFIADLQLGTSTNLVSSLSQQATPDFIAGAKFNGAGTLMAVAQGAVTVEAQSNLQSNSNLTIYPLFIQAAASLVGGTGVVNAYGGFLAEGVSTLNSNGLLNGNLEMIHNAVVISEPLRRVTESGDPRIVDEGGFREAYGVNNMVAGSLSSTPTTTPFAGKLYAHRNGSYGLVEPSVKRNGSWVVPKVYVKDNGTWKRVY